MRSLKRVLDEMSELSIKLMDTRDYTVFWNSDNEEYLERIIAESRECYMCKVKGCEQRKKHYAVAQKALSLAKRAYKDQITATEWMHETKKLVEAAGWDLYDYSDCPDSDQREAENNDKFYNMLY